MWVLAAHFDLHIPAALTLKEKRRVVRPVIDGLRAHFNAGVAEVDGHDLWQRCGVGVSLVGSDAGVLEKVLHDMEKFVCRHPGLELLDVTERLYQTDDD